MTTRETTTRCRFCDRLPEPACDCPLCYGEGCASAEREAAYLADDEREGEAVERDWLAPAPRDEDSWFLGAADGRLARM